MEITELRVRKIIGGGALKAYASIVFDNCLAVHNLKVIQKNEDLFVSMPSRKSPDGKYWDIFHPTNQEFRTYIQDAILGDFNAGKFNGESDLSSRENLDLAQ